MQLGSVQPERLHLDQHPSPRRRRNWKLADRQRLGRAWRVEDELSREYESKGTAIANSIAGPSVEILLHRDAASVQALIDQYLDIDGVGYVFVEDEKGLLDGTKYGWLGHLKNFIIYKSRVNYNSDCNLSTIVTLNGFDVLGMAWR